MTAVKSAPRCRACQLQLCKGRGERPHAQLQECAALPEDELPHGTALSPAGRAIRKARQRQASYATFYSCQTCGVVLARSTDLTEPGWSHQRS